MNAIDLEFAQLQITYFQSLSTKESELQGIVQSIRVHLTAEQNGTHAKDQWKLLQAPCHKFAGSSGTYGMSGLSESFRFMEDRIADGSLASLNNSSLLPVLDTWWKCHQGIFKVYSSLTALAQAGDPQNFSAELLRLDPTAQGLWKRMAHELLGLINERRNAA